MGKASQSSGSRTAILSPVEAWKAADPGVLSLPSGRLIRGRSLRRPPADGLMPDFGLYLGGRELKTPAVGRAVGPLAGFPAACEPE